MENLFKEVYRLVKQGYGRAIIQRELGLSQKKTENMIKAVREKYPQLPPAGTSRNRKLHINIGHNVHTAPQVKKKNIKKALLKEKNIDKVEALLEEGLGCTRISDLLGMPENTVSRYITQSKTKLKKLTRSMLLEEKMLETDDIYELCKSMSTSPSGLKQLISKKEGTFNPAGSAVKKLVSKSSRYSQIKKEFGNKISLARAKEIILDNFPNHFIVETKLPDGDIQLTPIKDSSSNIEWLNNKLDRDFKYYVNDDSNYMSVLFNDKLPGSEITIFNITDIHVGSKAFRKELLVDVINYIKDTPMAFFVIGGDSIEAITKMSVGDPIEQYSSINDQAVEAVKLFKPIAHKCIAMEWGNHCGGRTEKAAQFDLARMMAQMLGVPYFRSRVTIDLNFRATEKRISLAHKYKNAIHPTAVVKEVKTIAQDLSYNINCWFSGHSHQAYIVPIETTILMPGQGFMQERNYVANGGSFVKYTGTYAEKEGYGPQPQDLVYFTFNDKGDHNAASVPITSL